MLLCSLQTFATQNKSLQSLLGIYRNSDFNLLIAPPNMIVSANKKRTRSAIIKGYADAYRLLRRELIKRKMSAAIAMPGVNQRSKIKACKRRGSNAEVCDELRKLLEEETVFYSDILKIPLNKEELGEESSASSEDDEDNLDIGLDDFVVADDDDVKNGADPRELFLNRLLAIGSIYQPDADLIHAKQVKALFPGLFGKKKLSNVHAVFGLTFFPTIQASQKMMKMYIFLFTVNTESKSNDLGVTVSFRPIKPYNWHRRASFISGRTGSAIRKLLNEITGGG